MPKLPERKSNEESSRGSTPRPYTAMAINGLGAGLSWRDMRHMKYTHLMQFLYEYEDMNGADVDEIVDATPKDVMALTRL